MRRPEYFMSREDALDFLARAELMQMVGVSPDGLPVIRTLNGVVVDGQICFHGSLKGEKTELIGSSIVISADEVVARIPSYFVDPELACPATTLYRSVQLHGALRSVEDPESKARVLTALMKKLQPEGGYAPIDPSSDLYRAQVNGTLICAVPLDHLTGKAKLGQNRSARERARILELLWERGAPGDDRAIELIRRHAADTPTPGFLTAPPGLRFIARLDESDVDRVVSLIRDAYWNDPFSGAQLRRAHLESTAWVGARDEQGACVASARAVSDGGKYAWIYDVFVVPEWRRKGVALALMRLLLSHAAVRSVRRVWLATKDAQPLYAKLGFVPRSELPPRPYESTEMVLDRVP